MNSWFFVPPHQEWTGWAFYFPHLCRMYGRFTCGGHLKWYSNGWFCKGILPKMAKTFRFHISPLYLEPKWPLVFGACFGEFLNPKYEGHSHVPGTQNHQLLGISNNKTSLSSRKFSTAFWVSVSGSFPPSKKKRSSQDALPPVSRKDGQFGLGIFRQKDTVYWGVYGSDRDDYR